MSHSYAILESIFEYQIHNFYGKADASVSEYRPLKERTDRQDFGPGSNDFINS